MLTKLEGKEETEKTRKFAESLEDKIMSLQSQLTELREKKNSDASSTGSSFHHGGDVHSGRGRGGRGRTFSGRTFPARGGGRGRGRGGRGGYIMNAVDSSRERGDTEM